MQATKQQFDLQWQNLKLSAKEKVLVAVSTGADSMALLWLLAHLPVAIRPQINVAYVDHQLRDQSKAETEFIQRYCQEHGYPLFTKTWAVAEHPQTGLEEKARKMRYGFFATVLRKQKIKYLLTAHHADDQAETFLMKLLRGGDLAQLTGIKSRRKFGARAELLRPLLGFTKAQLLHLVQEQNITYFEDETNEHDDYLRNRLRHHVIPRLKQENPQFLAHVENYATQLSEVLSLADEASKEKLAKLRQDDGSYALEQWQTLDLPWQNQLLRQLFCQQQLELSEKKLAQASRLLNNTTKPQGQLDLGQGYFLVKEYHHFWIADHLLPSENLELQRSLSLGEWQWISDTEKVGLFFKDVYRPRPGDEVLAVSEEEAPFLLRHRLPGDRMKTKIGTQKIKQILIDRKIAKTKRERLWLVAAKDGNILWVVKVKKTDLSPRLVNAKMQYIIVLRREVKDDE